MTKILFFFANHHAKCKTKLCRKLARSLLGIPYRCTARRSFLTDATASKNKYITVKPTASMLSLRSGRRSLLGIGRCILWECAAAVFYPANPCRALCAAAAKGRLKPHFAFSDGLLPIRRGEAACAKPEIPNPQTMLLLRRWKSYRKPSKRTVSSGMAECSGILVSPPHRKTHRGRLKEAACQNTVLVGTAFAYFIRFFKASRTPSATSVSGAMPLTAARASRSL